MRKMVSLRFDMELWEQLKAKATELNRSTTNLIETILWDWIRNQ